MKQNFSRTQLLVIVSVCILAFAGGALCVSAFSKKQVAYVDGRRLFDKFRMTIEAKKKGDQSIDGLNRQIESLYARMKVSSAGENARLVREIAHLQDSMRSFEQQFVSNQTRQIFARLKTYSTEFAQAKSYDLILAPQDETQVLFVQEQCDVTDELINYANKRYEGN
ncbi:OmpH family outer membrane protein [Flavobacterium sp. MAH-1]|uniref:OmpH family outer membrane protein n=1 Tax=Flavobacterium agri TaxID=2743471 RepID=A0A7Y9C6V7_9FLAO|nr:OmpH family outer membrane protein [Flavobacterium agri]NUY82698.1 OmpH family outer membrane protein [Flavobacterium agri]NYA72721.1 OmpH family outer membrane protein [Flavobacterium agri]